MEKPLMPPVEYSEWPSPEDDDPPPPAVKALGLRDLPRNTIVSLSIEPFSSFLASILTFYQTLYMQTLGVDAYSIGVITTIAACNALVMQALAAPIVNRLGRRPSLFYFSLLCWSTSLLLWALADGFVLFLGAALFFSTSKITTVAWLCTATDDAAEVLKPKMFGVLFLIQSFGGLGTLAAIPFIKAYGLVPFIRALYLVTFFSMTGMFVARHCLITETAAGVLVLAEQKGMSFLGNVAKSLSSARAMLRDREFLRLSLLFALFNLALQMFLVLQVLFANNVLLLTVEELSYIPPVTAVVNVACYALLVPRVGADNVRVVMACALLVYAAGFALLLAIPQCSLAPALAAAGVSAAGAYLVNVSVNAAINIQMGVLGKADGYTAVLLFTGAATIPAGYLAGALFSFSPAVAITTTGGLAALAAGIAVFPSPAALLAWKSPWATLEDDSSTSDAAPPPTPYTT